MGNPVVLVNLTPHTINIRSGDNTIVVPPSGGTARVASKSVPAGDVNGTPLVRTEYGAVEGIPDPIPGNIYLVSAMVLARTTRSDVVAPDTGPTAIRENGNILPLLDSLLLANPAKEGGGGRRSFPPWSC